MITRLGKKAWPVLLILMLTACRIYAQRHISVLWLGNSYIADNRAGIHLDRATAQMINTAHDSGLTDMVVDTFEQSIMWAMGLAAHYYDSTSMALVASGRFTHVVIQGYILTEDTIEMRTSAESNFEFGQYIADEVRAAGAVPIMYCAHPRCDATEFMWQFTIDAYRKAADSSGSVFAPVSVAWRNAITANPDFVLYQGDCIHQNANGIFLNAAMFYCVLTGESVVGNPVRSVGPTIEDDTATFMQQVAWATYDSVMKANPQRVQPSGRNSSGNRSVAHIRAVPGAVHAAVPGVDGATVRVHTLGGRLLGRSTVSDGGGVVYLPATRGQTYCVTVVDRSGRTIARSVVFSAL